MTLVINIAMRSNIILYTYSQDGQKHALIVQNDLAPIPNGHAVKEAMLNSRTPLAVRTMLFNDLVNRIRPMAERGAVAENVFFRHTADGFTFLEVELSPDGLDYTKKQHIRRAGYYPIPNYVLFDPNAQNALLLYRKFSKPLKKALALVGIYK